MKVLMAMLLAFALCLGSTQALPQAKIQELGHFPSASMVKVQGNEATIAFYSDDFDTSDVLTLEVGTSEVYNTKISLKLDKVYQTPEGVRRTKPVTLIKLKLDTVYHFRLTVRKYDGILQTSDAIFETGDFTNKEQI